MTSKSVDNEICMMITYLGHDKRYNDCIDCRGKGIAKSCYIGNTGDFKKYLQKQEEHKLKELFKVEDKREKLTIEIAKIHKLKGHRVLPIPSKKELLERCEW